MVVLKALVVSVLVACGGGDSDDGSRAGQRGVSLSGQIATGDAMDVDSDINDVNHTDARDNNSLDAAQPLVAPITVVGTVNQAGTGPQGRNFAAGDPEDIFRVDLVRGQVLSLEFAAEAGSNDVDLCAASIDGQRVACSEGANSRFECLKVQESGAYFVRVSAFKAASIYSLTVSMPDGGGQCDQQIGTASFQVGELLARRADGLEATAGPSRGMALEAKAGVQIENAGLGEVMLMRLPLSAASRRGRLQALAGSMPPAVAELGGERATNAVADSPELSRVSAAFDTYGYAKRLKASGQYRYVEPHWVFQRTAVPSLGGYPPGDAAYNYQRWHYELINLPSAIDYVRQAGSATAPNPIVAVIDDGVMLDHPDLSSQLTDSGRSFISGGSGDGDSNSADAAAIPEDPVFHGTHVAGTVAAATFQAGAGSGGAGVAPMARVMPVRVFSRAGGGSRMTDMLAAMLYAAGLSNRSGLAPSRRADVINLSLGSMQACPAAVQDVVDQVRAAGVIVVAAAGNESELNRGVEAPVGSPANCRGVIAVGATDAQAQQAPYSNGGPELTVVAPGGDTNQRTNGTGRPDGIYSDWGDFVNGQRVASMAGLQGTSMASPHVAGVMALMKFINPALTPADVDNLLAQGALTDDLGGVGRDPHFGWGLINARKAVEAAAGGGGGPVTGSPVQASPSTLAFGNRDTSLSLKLRADTGTAERVTGIRSDNSGVTVEGVAVDGNTGLGTYRVSVDRSRLGGSGTVYPVLTVTLEPSRTFTVQLSVNAATTSAGAGHGRVGPLYVLLRDPDADETVAVVMAQEQSGVYNWRYDGYDRARVMVLAGGDLDNDDRICQRGEVCGAYPMLSNRDQMAISLSGSRSDINFSVSALGGATVRSQAGSTRVDDAFVEAPWWSSLPK